MNCLVVLLVLSCSAQVTPRDLARRQEAKRQREEPRAGTTRTNLDPPPGMTFAFPSVGAQCRAIDKRMTTAYALSIGWPHRGLGGRVYDQLDRAGRESLLNQQIDYLVAYGTPQLPGSTTRSINVHNYRPRRTRKTQRRPR